MGVDRGAASLTEKLSGGVVGGGGGVSGLQDRDYRAVSGSGGPEALAPRQGAKVTRVPLPAAELVEVNIYISSPAFEIYLLQLHTTTLTLKAIGGTAVTCKKESLWRLLKAQ